MSSQGEGDRIIGARRAQAWHRWLDSPPGAYVRAWQQRACEQVVSDIFGYHALQCGNPVIDCLSANRMPNRVIVCCGDDLPPDPRPQASAASGWPPAGDPGSGLRGSTPFVPTLLIDHFGHLPFATQSVDLVVLPHVLEFADEPHEILREVDRVLRPEGRLVVTGFNPVSLWGLRQSLGSLAGREWLPEPAQMITIARLRDWLKLLGLSVDEVLHGCYRPAFDSARWLQRFQFIERAGDRWWPILGAVYLLAGVKRIPGMRLQGPVLRKRFSRRVAAPVASHRDTYSRETREAD
jgi:SAM-dependent methyltransferase